MLSYIQLGVQHILDFNGYDHMLFIAVLLSGVPPKAWKSILLMITAFTVGHSLTLAYSILASTLIPSNWVEFLIPVTIMLTAVSNFTEKKENQLGWKIAGTSLFGLIHGMGFAGYLSALLPKGAALWKPLLFFNVGVELGQLVIAGSLILLFLIAQSITQYAVRPTQLAISVVGFAVSLLLAIQKWPLL